MASRTQRYRQQAADLALVRYGPEISALTALLKQAEETRRQTIGGAKTSMQVIQSAADLARPEIRDVYKTAIDTAAAQRAAIGVGPGSIEQAGLESRLAEEQAAALTDLSNRRVGAAAGYAGARRQAQQVYGQTIGQIGDRVRALSQEQGAYTSSTLFDLLGADAKARADAQRLSRQLANTRGNAWIAAGIDPATGKPIPGGKLDPKTQPNQGRGWASDSAQATAGDVIQTGLHAALRLKQGNVGREDAAAALRIGAKPRPIYRTIQVKNAAGQVTGTKQQKVLNPNGTPKMTPSLPQISQELYLQAALDMAYLGHLSKRTQTLLHRRGIKLNPLGVTTLGDYQQQVASRVGTGNLANRNRPSRPYYGPAYGR